VFEVSDSGLEQLFTVGEDCEVPPSFLSLAYFEPCFDWVLRLDHAVRYVDSRISTLKAFLRILNRRIQAVLGLCRSPRFLRGVVVVQSRFFAVHGNHPPRVSGGFICPINSLGAWAAV
jgi:hypothetical protein